jgi:hypothetical protein
MMTAAKTPTEPLPECIVAVLAIPAQHEKVGVVGEDEGEEDADHVCGVWGVGSVRG